MTKPVDNSQDRRTPDNESARLEALAEAGAGPKDEAADNRRIFKKTLWLLGGLLALVMLAALPPVRHLFQDLHGHHLQKDFKQYILDCGPWAPVVFTAGVAVLVGGGFPRLAFHLLGGALFAFWGGLLWSMLGTLLGYTVVFFAVRQTGLREVIQRKHPG